MSNQTGHGAVRGSSAKSMLLHSASAGVLAMIILSATPAQAQLAARRGPTLTAPTIGPTAVPGQLRSPLAVDAAARAAAARSRADEIRDYASQARAALARSVPEGMQGLVVARGVTAQSLA